jgi:hypothetical protein
VSLPIPEPGPVIRYAYLWEVEARQGPRGRHQGSNCAIVLVVLREGEHPIVRVLPVTHTPPTNPEDALEIPTATSSALGWTASAHGWC